VLVTRDNVLSNFDGESVLGVRNLGVWAEVRKDFAESKDEASWSMEASSRAASGVDVLGFRGGESPSEGKSNRTIEDILFDGDGEGRLLNRGGDSGFVGGGETVCLLVEGDGGKGIVGIEYSFGKA
jgi:hypothetical protein